MRGMTAKALLLLPLLWLTAAAAGVPPYSQGYDPGRDPYADARDAIERAGRSGRHVLIVVGGDWCTWCHELDRVIKADPLSREALATGYVLLKVNVSDANPNSAFMASMPRLDGYPQLFVSDGHGQLLHAQDPSAFLADGAYDSVRVRTFLLRWAPRSP
ncbi:MAG: thioredoxin family protein [Gammaproteobacteria bacterium]